MKVLKYILPIVFFISLSSIYYYLWFYQYENLVYKTVYIRLLSGCETMNYNAGTLPSEIVLIHFLLLLPLVLFMNYMSKKNKNILRQFLFTLLTFFFIGFIIFYLETIYRNYFCSEMYAGISIYNTPRILLEYSYWIFIHLVAERSTFLYSFLVYIIFILIYLGLLKTERENL